MYCVHGTLVQPGQQGPRSTGQKVHTQFRLHIDDVLDASGILKVLFADRHRACDGVE